MSSQLSSVLTWQNIPGGLTKVSSSAAGFAWGYNSDDTVWSCQLPCSGNWQNSDLSAYSVGTILDIATDANTVYVLYTTMSGNTQILTTDATRQGVWSTLKVPISATRIFSTHTYLWAQDSNNVKQMCPKPCTMGNWIPSQESTITITSSTDTHLYGKDPTGEPMQTDETMRSGWSPIQGFGNTKVQTVIGGDKSLYAIDEKSNPITYDGKSVQPLPTSGFTPLNITTANNQLWMTSVEPSGLGNVFNRFETPDYATIVNNVSSLDRKRDEVVSDVEKAYNQQTDVMTVNKQTKDVVDFFKKIFKLDGDTAHKAKAQAGHINEQIRSTQQQIDQMNALEPILQIAIGMLLAICLVYILIGGVASHVVALGILGVGTYFILKSK